MHITDALRLLQDSDYEWLQNIIMDELDIVMEGWTVFSQHALFQLEPQLLLKPVVTFRSSEHISCSVNSVHLVSISELFHGNTFCQHKSPLISSYTLHQLNALLHNLSIFICHLSSQNAFYVLNTFIYIPFGSDFYMFEHSTS